MIHTDRTEVLVGAEKPREAGFSHKDGSPAPAARERQEISESTYMEGECSCDPKVDHIDCSEARAMHKILPEQFVYNNTPELERYRLML